MAIYYDKQSKLEIFEKVIATLESKLASITQGQKKRTLFRVSSELINYDANCYPKNEQAATYGGHETTTACLR